VSLFVQHDSDFPDAPGVVHGSCFPCDAKGDVPKGHTSLPLRKSLESRWVVEFDYPDVPALLAKHNLRERLRHEGASDWSEDVLDTAQRCYKRGTERTITPPWMADTLRHGKADCTPVHVDRATPLLSPEWAAMWIQAADVRRRMAHAKPAPFADAKERVRRAIKAARTPPLV
jgi:hypothetical protein